MVTTEAVVLAVGLAVLETLLVVAAAELLGILEKSIRKLSAIGRTAAGMWRTR